LDGADEHVVARVQPARGERRACLRHELAPGSDEHRDAAERDVTRARLDSRARLAASGRLHDEHALRTSVNMLARMIERASLVRPKAHGFDSLRETGAADHDGLMVPSSWIGGSSDARCCSQYKCRRGSARESKCVAGASQLRTPVAVISGTLHL
jgi:hypothetical protein